MTECFADFSVIFEAKSLDELDEILLRLKAALESTEWKVQVEDFTCEEA